jgi:hypothetical protein
MDNSESKIDLNQILAALQHLQQAFNKKMLWSEIQ